MTARVQLIVEAKDGASGILRGIASQFGALGNVIEGFTSKNIAWGDIATQVTGLVVDGLKSSYEAAQKYSQSVRDLALVSGTGAEESSRLLQVLDDFQISAEDVTAATRTMTKNGLVPTVETLAQLSDQYLAINDAQERNDFILKNLGRSGLQWVNVLNQGSDALRANGEQVNANLILTDKQVQDMEMARLAQDAWNDTIEGAKIATGAWIGSLVAVNDEVQRALKLLESHGVQINANTMRTQEFRDALQQVRDAEGGNATALDSATRSYIALGKAMLGTVNPALEDTDENFKGLISSAQALGDVTDENVKKAAYNMLQLKLAADGVISPQDEQILEESGLALGVVDKKSLEATKSIGLFTDQVAEGTITVLQFVDAINSIPATVNVSTGTLTGAAGGYQQIGGQVYAGQMSMVGEAGAEPFIPQQNGRILSHAESLHALTMGAGGSSNYFYGNVTLQIGEGDSGSLLAAR